MGHQAINKGGVDGQRDEKADALDSEATDNDGEGVTRIVDAGTQVAGVRADDEERICWKDPDRGHAGNREGLCGPSEILLVDGIAVWRMG